jgi:16S rRNA (guanine966-N2)-methyltransferase
MRVIAGEFRGRKLLAPEGDVTRPVTDRVKQSLFDILAPRLGGARVYDLFAGTGSMGLECLSRGAAHATFFEADRSAVQRLKKNIAAVGVADRSTVVAGDLFRWFAAADAGRADLVFLDPPYRFVRERAADLQSLSTRLVRHHLPPDGLIVFRHDAKDQLRLDGTELVDRREYGSMSLQFLRPLSRAQPDRLR